MAGSKANFYSENFELSKKIFQTNQTLVKHRIAKNLSFPAQMLVDSSISQRFFSRFGAGLDKLSKAALTELVLGTNSQWGHD